MYPALPPIPQPPRDRWGNNVENVWALSYVWDLLITTVSGTLPDLLWRLAWDVQNLINSQ